MISVDDLIIIFCKKACNLNLFKFHKFQMLVDVLGTSFLNLQILDMYLDNDLDNFFGKNI